MQSAYKQVVVGTVTREELLEALEARLAETLREYGISASVVAKESEAITLPPLPNRSMPAPTNRTPICPHCSKVPMRTSPSWTRRA